MDALRDLILPALPARLGGELYRLAESYSGLTERLSELRVRVGRLASLTVDGRNLPLSTVLSESEMSDALRTFCRGSVYAYTESMREGYITLPLGCRVGLSGRAIVEGGRVVGLGEVSSMSVRLARRVPGAEEVAYDFFCRLGGRSGLLIYAPPGVGKTTALRELGRRLSSGPRALRVAVIDSRGELDAGQFSRGCLVDVLRGYPKGAGIETAIRTLSPEVILCDEIGSREDAEAILSVQYAGVPLIATAHAESLRDIRAETSLLRLFSAGVFGGALGLSRDAEGEYHYTETVLRGEGELCVR